MKTDHMTITEISEFCKEHAELIDTEINKRKKEAKDSDGFLSFNKVSDIRGYRNTQQYFAISGNSATNLVVIEDDGNLWIPVIVDGAIYESYPEEGRGGIAHLCNIKVPGKSSKWIVIWFTGGWLTKDEFETLSPVEIIDVLEDEIFKGKKSIIKKLPGWEVGVRLP